MKKRLILMFISLLLYMVEVINVYATSNPYRESGPYGTNCTWYAWKMAYEKAGVSLPGWSNAKNWYNDAKNDGYEVGTTPRANSIIVWGGWTSYGHVGYVEAVKDNILYVWDSTGPCIDRNDPEFIECIENGTSEETDKICYANAKRVACEYTISPDEYGITGYIYLDNAPKSPISSQLNSSKKDDSNDISNSKVKSNNANLKSISLNTGNIEFDKNKTEYNLEVENETDKITIDAIKEDETASIVGIGQHELKIGLNDIKITVTAEDGSIKEYTLKITRKELESVVKKESVANDKNQSIKNSKSKNLKIPLIILLTCLFASITLLIFNRRK